jgi:hypothetical protein
MSSLPPGLTPITPGDEPYKLRPGQIAPGNQPSPPTFSSRGLEPWREYSGGAGTTWKPDGKGGWTPAQATIPASALPAGLTPLPKGLTPITSAPPAPPSDPSMSVAEGQQMYTSGAALTHPRTDLGPLGNVAAQVAGVPVGAARQIASTVTGAVELPFKAVKLLTGLAFNPQIRMHTWGAITDAINTLNHPPKLRATAAALGM